ncbi:hypothetical protein ACLM5H_20745 [Fredinandcohnia humi]
MDRGTKVWYNGEPYEILHIYESGFCEIRKLETGRVSLVHKDELEDENHK